MSGNYPDPPRTEWGDLPLLSEADDPEEYRDLWGVVQDEEGYKQLQKQVVVPFDTYDDFPTEGPFDGARAEAREMNVIFEWDADASDWTPANTGTSERPVPGTSHYESVDVRRAGIDLHTTPIRSNKNNFNPQVLGEQPAGWTLESFQDINDNWSVDTGTAELDTDETFGGLPSLHCHNPDGWVWFTKEYDQPIDLSDKDFSIMLKGPGQDSDTESSRFTVYFRDTDGNQAGTRPIVTNGINRWVRVSCPWRDALDIDAIDMSAIDQVRIRNEEGKNESEFWVADLRVHESDQKGTIIFKFDDGNGTQYEYGLPALRKRGFAGTAFVHVGRVIEGDDRGGHWGLEEAYEFQEAGFDICSHNLDGTQNHLLSGAELRDHIVGSKEILLEHGFDRGARFYHSPSSSMTEEAFDLVVEHYEAGIGTGNEVPSSGGLRARSMFPMMGTAGGDGVASSKEAIDWAIEHNDLSFITWHGTPESEIEEVAEYAYQKVRAGDLRVVTLSQLYDSWQSWQSGIGTY